MQDWNDEGMHDHGNVSAAVAQDEDDDANLIMSKRVASKLTIELAVFVESVAYNKYMPYLGSVQAVTDFFLGYINQVRVLLISKCDIYYISNT